MTLQATASSQALIPTSIKASTADGMSPSIHPSIPPPPAPAQRRTKSRRRRGGKKRRRKAREG